MNPSRRTVRSLFVILVPLLFLQFAFVRTHGEPYPALALPAFDSVPEQSGRIGTTEWTLRVELADGSSREIARDELLQGAANSHREFILRTHYSSQGATGPPAQRDALRVWTRERCRQITGRQDVARLVVETSVVTRSDAHMPEVLSRDVVDEFEMDLQ